MISSHSRRSLRCVAAIPLAVFLCAIASAQTSSPAAIPVDLVVPFVPPPVTAEGERHLIYELHITNFGRADLALRQVDVLDGETGTVLQSYGGDSLQSVLSRAGSAGLPDKRTISAGLRAVVFIDYRVPEKSSFPRTLRHRLTFVPVTPPNGPIQSVVDGAAITVQRQKLQQLAPPVAGSGWLASHGLSNGSSHRRTLLAIDGRARIAQRFAIDWTRIGPDGQVFRGDPAINANWTPYGAEVLAVGDGRIVEIQDGVLENDPTSETKAVPITLSTVGGNYLILDLGDGRFAFYAHLQPRSFTVGRGQRVRKGQRIARLGNSGQSDAPHLHLHIANAPSPLAAEGLPLSFEKFFLLGHVPSLKVLTDGTGWRQTEHKSRRRGEMPIENAVVGFDVH